LQKHREGLFTQSQYYSEGIFDIYRDT